MNRTRVVVLLGAFVVGTTCAAAFALGAWLFSPVTPEQLAPAPSAAWSPVTPRMIDDARQVDLAINLSDATPLRSAATGLVTSTSCSKDGVLESGQTALTVDGRPIVALSTDIPLWRNLAVGDSGTDVAALQHELARLGYELETGGVVDTDTLNAAGKLVGLSQDEMDSSGTIERDSLIWLPTASVTVAQCDAGTGTRISPGDTLITAAGTIEDARIASLPESLVAGSRHLVVDDRVISVSESGVVNDQAGLESLHQTSSFSLWAADPQSAPPVRGSLVLSEPTTAYSLAPASIYNLDGTAGCVYTGSTGLPVTVVSSELGHTLVTFDSASTAPDQVLIAADGGPTCR